MACTQPRRISAVALARRVVGSSVPNRTPTPNPGPDPTLDPALDLALALALAKPAFKSSQRKLYLCVVNTTHTGRARAH